jgi:GH24 family phage-related lysozyme (muramidase)
MRKLVFLLLFIGANINPQSYYPNIEDYKIVQPIIEDEVSIFENEFFLFNVFLNHIRSYEDYLAVAVDDYGEPRYGWGTTADYIGQKITLCDANKRSAEALTIRVDLIKSLYPNLSIYQTYIMAAVEYNLVHIRWKGLRRKVQSADSKLIARSLIHYNKAGGVKNKGLVERRQIEVDYLLAEGNEAELRCLMESTMIKLRKKTGNIDLNKCL